MSRCGAADEMSLRTANALVGNEVDAAALECLGGLRLRSRETRAVSVAGADCQATILRSGGGSVACKVNEAVVLRAGDELRLGIPRDGARAYVGVEGGVDAPLVLGSRSSDVRAGFGMAPLAAGDMVECGGAGGRAAPRRAKHDNMIRMKGKQTWTLRVLPGPGDPASDDGVKETDADASLKALLAAGPFAASPRSDRMAVVAEAASSLTGASSSPRPAPPGRSSCRRTATPSFSSRTTRRPEVIVYRRSSRGATSGRSASAGPATSWCLRRRRSVTRRPSCARCGSGPSPARRAWSTAPTSTSRRWRGGQTRWGMAAWSQPSSLCYQSQASRSAGAGYRRRSSSRSSSSEAESSSSDSSAMVIVDRATGTTFPSANRTLTIPGRRPSMLVR